MKIQQHNDWDTIEQILASNKEDPEYSRLYADLNDEDKMLVNTLGAIRLDCDNERALDAKEEIQERVYHKMFEDGKKTKDRNTPLIVLLTVAASVAVLLGISRFYGHEKPNEEISQVVFSSPNHISSIVLPDSSVVTLNRGSILTYTTDYNRQTRSVCLEGEAFFDVRTNPEKAFIVSTGDIDVKVLGTVFNVSAYPENSEVVTSLISGSVQLLNQKKEAVCKLTPNQSASYNKETSKIEISPYDPESTIDWMTGDIRFKKQSFHAICEALEKKFDCEIVIQNKSISNKKFTGKFMNDESLREILNTMQINIPFRYEIENNVVTIY
ncbi:MAG: FecR family protein [Dysgonamonadaceae bacterium]|jgi:ferric-dicitrate binding protein FerR (iron transport regulator)|nr:FecR family protein [Dysgonamonadaceae bacterium]